MALSIAATRTAGMCHWSFLWIEQTMTFGTVGGLGDLYYSAPMDTQGKGKEQIFLIGSGLLAVTLVAWISFQSTGSWLGLMAHAVFVLFFLAAAFLDLLALPNRFGIFALMAMLFIVLLSLFLFPDTVTLILAVVLIVSAPYHLSPRASWILLLLSNLLFWLEFEILLENGVFLPAWATLFALQIFAISSSLVRRREEESQRVLARQNDELLASRAIMSQRTRAEERLRIAGDLHDTIGHRLTALQLQLEALVHQTPDELKADVKRCKQVAAELLDEVRSIVKEIPSSPTADLSHAIRELAELTPGVTVSVEGDLPVVQPALAQQIIFCIQEGISNSIRHGSANKISIAFGNGELRISDNGRGLGPRGLREGFGLANIRQRLAPFSGSVNLDPRSDGTGCVLRLNLGEGVLA
ncbi:MAG: histidine kinase [Pseudomonadota bacterium]